MEQESNETCPSKSFAQKAQASNASCPQLLVLRNLLTENITALSAQLRKNAMKENWRRLAVLALAILIIFNQLRGNIQNSQYINKTYKMFVGDRVCRALNCRLFLF